MTAAVLQHVTRYRLSGVWVSLGHGTVEIPLILLLFVGAGKFMEHETVRSFVGLAGGAYLIFKSKGLLKPKALTDVSSQKVTSSLLAGIFLSIGNPYFLLWWGTIGLGLVLGSMAFGTMGLVLFIIVHWLADLVWYTFLSLISHKGVKTLGYGLYQKIIIFCGAIMFFYGGAFIIGTLRFFMAPKG